MTRHIFLNSILLGLLCMQISARNANGATGGTPKWQAFELGNLSRQRAESTRPYLRFLDKPSMSMGLYELRVGEMDEQSPHKLDEVYYIVAGEAVLRVHKEDIPVQPGSVIYVKAEVPHAFRDISEDLQVLVVFPKTKPDAKDKDWLAFKMDEIQSERESDENIWNPFLNVATMRFGLYMLPEKIGGDSTLTHRVDEVNIVINGSAQFAMGDDEISVQPGSIMWVQEGVGHYFHTLSEDFDVLILFEKRRNAGPDQR